jgi:P-aminobenzoate N-oxygenase AurF
LSLRNQYEPELAIDWEAPLDPDLFWIPPHRSSLYGTTVWAGLSHRRRVELTKHEVAAAASGGKLLWRKAGLIE